MPLGFKNQRDSSPTRLRRALSLCRCCSFCLEALVLLANFQPSHKPQPRRLPGCPPSCGPSGKAASPSCSPASPAPSDLTCPSVGAFTGCLRHPPVCPREQGGWDTEREILAMRGGAPSFPPVPSHLSKAQLGASRLNGGPCLLARGFPR